MSDTKETKHPGEDPDWLVRAREGLTNPSQSKTASPDPAQEVSPVVPNPAPETEQIEPGKIIDFSYVVAWNELQKAPETREDKIKKAIRDSNGHNEQRY